MIFALGTSCVTIFSWNLLHVDFSVRETCTLIFLLVKLTLFMELVCLLIFFHETCCILIFLCVKFVYRFFFSWNRFYSWNRLLVYLWFWNLLYADFCFWNLLNIDFSLRETCALILCSWNRFCSWNLLHADIRGTCYVLIFCSWNLLHVDLSLYETCRFIFSSLNWFVHGTSFLLIFLTCLVLIFGLVGSLCFSL